MITNKTSKSMVAGVLVAVAGTAGAQIVQTVNCAWTEHWNQAKWGSPAAVPSGGNDYQTASIGELLLRSADTTGADTFGGDSLDVVEGSGFLLKGQGNAATVNGPFTLSGGHMYFGPNSPGTWNMTLAVDSFAVSGESDISLGPNLAAGGVTINKNLTGSGHLYLHHKESGHSGDTVHFAGISDFSGKITVGDHSPSVFKTWTWGYPLTLSLGSTSYTFQDTVTIFGGAILQVNAGQTLTFPSGTLVDPVNGTVAAGTYDTTTLGANYAGAGTIVVQAAAAPGTVIYLE